MKATAALMLFAVAVTATAADVVDGVPSQFLGEWNSFLAHCGTGNNDSALRIGRSHIYYYESDGPIKAAVVHGHYEIALIAELSGKVRLG